MDQLHRNKLRMYRANLSKKEYAFWELYGKFKDTDQESKKLLQTIRLCDDALHTHHIEFCHATVKRVRKIKHRIYTTSLIAAFCAALITYIICQY